MRIENLLGIAKVCCVFGAVIFAVGLLLYFAVYKIIYLRIIKGKKSIATSTYIWVLLMIWYFVTIFYVALGGRGNIYIRKIRPLFSSYYEAWCSWSVTDWRNIILNYCLFIPFGFFLPLKLKLLRKIYITGLFAFGFSCIIEIIQFINKSGVFELDDLLGNTIGALIGFGVYGIFANFILSKKEYGVHEIFLMQIPLFIVLMGFGIIFITYNIKTLGNNKNAFYYGYDTDIISVICDIPLNSDTEEVDIYKTDVLSFTEAMELAESKMQAYPLEDRDKDKETFEDHVILKYSSDESEPFEEIENYAGPHIEFCQVTYRGGFYKCVVSNGADISGKKNILKVDSFDENSIKRVLNKINEILPDNYIFEESKTHRFVFKYDHVPFEDCFLIGEFTCSFTGKMLQNYENHIIKCRYFGKGKVISQQEAFNRIKEGKFRISNENIAKGIFNDSTFEIHVNEVVLEFEIDSKGFLQPQYRFLCKVNGKKKDIIIPCLK